MLLASTFWLPLAAAIALLGFTPAVEAQTSTPPRATPSGPQSRPVAPADAYSRIRAKQSILIDTREASEKTVGSPDGVGAEIVYRMTPAADPQFVADVLKAVNGDRNADITLICAAGIRSAAAQQALTAAGFTNARIVQGGYFAWVNAGLPKK